MRSDLNSKLSRIYNFWYRWTFLEKYNYIIKQFLLIKLLLGLQINEKDCRIYCN